MTLSRAACLVFLIVAAPALAQLQPQSAGGDPRLQAVDYDSGTVVQLRGAPGYQMMVELSPDEQVQSVALGDASAWQVSVSKSGDRLFLKPAQPGVSTNMTVVTSVRVYNFDLASVSAPSPDMPYTVEFRYPSSESARDDAQYVDVAGATRRITRYKVTGDKQLWPSGMTNDGQHTFIVWPRSAPIPAVYAVDSRGRDVLVNGMMGADDIYVIDGVPDRISFRINDNVAYAVCVAPKKRC
jgi:type IV secretion system protein VirB9